MKETSSSAANDPRQSSTAEPYVPTQISPQDLPVDYAGFLAVVFGVTGVMFRYKLCSWLAIIFCAQSLGNMKNMENDLKQISMAMIPTDAPVRRVELINLGQVKKERRGDRRKHRCR